MLRGLAAVTLMLALAGCNDYDRYSPVVNQDGLVPPDVFAAYGAEQAEAIAIGRTFGAAFTGTSLEARGAQVAAAAAYAANRPGVAHVKADTSATLLTITFSSGWTKAVVPISDGIPAEKTVGLKPAN
ncbi:MAG: hypothetical protein AAB075_03590 [Gemmatimonadota bacterium]